MEIVAYYALQESSVSNAELNVMTGERNTSFAKMISSPEECKTK